MAFKGDSKALDAALIGASDYLTPDQSRSRTSSTLSEFAFGFDFSRPIGCNRRPPVDGIGISANSLQVQTNLPA